VHKCLISKRYKTYILIQICIGINDYNSFKTHENILVDDIIWLMIEHVSFIMSMFMCIMFMSTTISMYTVLMQQHDTIFVWSAYCSKTQNLPPGWEKRTLLSNSLNCRVQGALRNSARHNASVQWTTDTCPWTSVARPVDSGSTVTITSALCSNSCTNAAAGDWAPASTGRDKPRLLSVSAWTRATTPHL
jgi:hypothetical protein